MTGSLLRAHEGCSGSDGGHGRCTHLTSLMRCEAPGPLLPVPLPPMPRKPPYSPKREKQVAKSVS